MSLLNVENGKIALEIIPYKFDETTHRILSGEELEYIKGYINHISEPIHDERRLRSLFDSWCMIAGIGGFGQLHYMNAVDAFRNEWVDDFKKNHTKDLTRIKNVFCCEAHNELMRNSFDVIYNDKMDEAVSGIDYIRNLQQLKY
jgi:hypothetical protein